MLSGMAEGDGAGVVGVETTVSEVSSDTIDSVVTLTSRLVINVCDSASIVLPTWVAVCRR
jgi:hypothetical protein